MRNILTHTTTSLLLLSLAAVAGAQEATFGFDDASLDTMPPTAAAYADLVGGSLAIDGSALLATLEFAALPEVQPGVAYIFTFSNGTTAFWAGIVTAPDIGYFYGEWISVDEGPRNMYDTTGSYSAGAPGTVTIGFPLDRLAGSTVLSSPAGMTADIKGGASPVGGLPTSIVLDTAQGEGELLLPARAAPDATADGSAQPAADETPAASPSGTPAPDAPAAVPGFAASAALGAMAGALLGAGRRSR